MAERYVGIDVGAETLKVVELVREAGRLVWTRRHLAEHGKNPGPRLQDVLADWGWPDVDGAAVSGRLARQINLMRVPLQQAQAAGYRYLVGRDAATVCSIGSHGFSVLEIRPGGIEVFRENSRCSQGTGNFLRQLVERFELTVEAASELCADVADPAPLSGRCPVILKTDMTHLANKGEERARIVAGLFDAVCENVQVLVKPRVSPPRVMLVGGVSRARRVREHFRRFLARHGMALVETRADDPLFLEALGSAVIAVDRPAPAPPLDRLLAPPPDTHLESVPALRESLARVRRMPPQRIPRVTGPREAVLGFDIGSTGSKAVALDAGTRETLWEGYERTNGDPVGAAQALMRQFTESPARICRVKAIGATGSGREIVGSLMATCYDPGAVFVLNEIAAHAAGALHFDPRVDTIFEIGGQDAKYIRLADGRVVDAAMNEACSAGTGSFIEEQGRKFAGIADVAQLGEEALEAERGVSLGQHCSVFMAEIIDEAVAVGADRRSIIAGIYDSIIQNYLNRVKGSRSVGRVVFCQGMPFTADALAAAVVRQTGSEVIIPPNPGTVGALGIALLTLEEVPLAGRQALDPGLFLAARVETRDTLVCKSSQGCGGAGNRCRIDRLVTRVAGERKRFTWGGACSLWDKGTRRKKLPDRAPDPFREREELVQALVRALSVRRGGPTVGLTDEFMLKGLFPFFATFLHRLGFDPVVRTGADQAVLKRGIEEANVPFCAPMQQFHGLASAMAEGKPDFLFTPMVRDFIRAKDEPHAVVCPIVQASPDMLRLDLGDTSPTRLVTPLVDMGAGNLESPAFVASCRRVAADFGVDAEERWRPAYLAGLAAQRRFDAACLDLGRRALAFCAEHRIVPVVVLGRSYTIYNTVLNSNVPAILREQGAIAIPVDCYPVADDVPTFHGMFWSYGQKNLRAAHQIRRTPGVYALYCSNYSCGPDSFTLHFFAYIMEGRPFAVIETDGHSGDAGTKTRVEAFLHCVAGDLKAARDTRPNDFTRVDADSGGLDEVRARGETLLVPSMGPGPEVLAALMRSIGLKAEVQPLPNRDTLRAGRRHTSGKECVPMTITLGSLLERIEAEPGGRFAFLMPTAAGPCRFGAYRLLHRMVLERLGHADRVRIVSPGFGRYYAGVPDGFATLVFTSLASMDLLLEALYDARPVEIRPGVANETFARYKAELLETVEAAGRGGLSAARTLAQVVTGRLFGCTDLLRRAAAELEAIRGNVPIPSVLVVGEIYVRCNPFANDFVVEKLEARGLRVRFATSSEWFEYSDYVDSRNGGRRDFGSRLSSFVRGVIQSRTRSAMARALGWPPRTTVPQALAAAAPYLREELQCEAVLTLGTSLHEWRNGHIDGVVSVGPLECMPNKIAQSQFFHAAEREGLPSLTLSVNGDPLSPDALDNFAFEVHARFGKRCRQTGARPVGHLATGPAPEWPPAGTAPARSRPRRIPAEGDGAALGTDRAFEARPCACVLIADGCPFVTLAGDGRSLPARADEDVEAVHGRP